MQHQGEMKTWHAISVGVIIGFLSGVGTMQATIVGDVREHTTRITYTEQRMHETDALFEQRIGYVVKLLEQTMESNREMIAMVKTVVMTDRMKNGNLSHP